MKKYTLTLTAVLLPAMLFIMSLKPDVKLKAINCYASKDGLATHNMLVVGEQTIYLSHLPMFQEAGQPPMPHRYQVILEVSFQQTGNTAADLTYAKDRQAHPAIKIYTINPKPFVLPLLIAPATQGGPLQSFKASIFRGHLEKGGQPIIPATDVAVKRVVYFKQFDATAKRPEQLEYLLFGKGKEVFMTHLITGPPDFDQVVSVALPVNNFTGEQLAKGLKVVFTTLKNTVASRLQEKQELEGLVSTGTVSQKMKFTVSREFYFEEGELKVPPVFDVTTAEKKAGFN